MKNYTWLKLMIFFAVSGLNAQTVLYTNDFQNASSFTLDNGGNTTNHWLINSVYAGGGFFSTPPVPSQPGTFSTPNGNYLHPRCVAFSTFVPENANYLIPFGNTISAYMSSSIDATGYDDITLSFWRTGGADGLSIVYSLDNGTTWTTAVSSVTGSPTTWQQETFTINALDGQANVRIGFRLSSDVTDPAPNHYHSIDEIQITGTAASSCTTVFGIDKIESCGQITWIDGNTYSSNNYAATHLLEGASVGGCDSLVTLNLTIWPCIQLRPSDCGATNVTMNQILRAINVGMPQYRFRITGANNGGPGWNNNQFIYDTPIGQNHFRFQFIPGSAWGATYAVEVAVGDGAGNYGPYGNVCNVTLENQTTTQITAAICGATVTMDNFVQADWAPGAVGYRFRIQGANNGGAGWSGNTFIYETTAPVRSFKFNNHIPGALFGETYSIDVAVLSGDNVWLPYGNACNVTIAAPSTQIQASQCGITDVALPTSILADNVVGASGYRFRITGVNSANWMNNQFILNRPNRVMQFQMVVGTVAGEVYQIEVAVIDANGNYGAYGSACNVTVAGAPAIAINDEIDLSSEQESFMANKSLIEVAFGANANHNPFTTEFGIQVLNANDSDLINVTVYDMSGKLIERNAVNPMDIETARFGANLASGMYMVEVRQGSNQAVIRQVKN